MTEKYKKKSRFYSFLSFFITVVPILIYVVIGFMEGTIGQKITLGMCLVAVVILVILNLLFKHIPRCGVWIILAGLA